MWICTFGLKGGDAARRGLAVNSLLYTHQLKHAQLDSESVITNSFSFFLKKVHIFLLDIITLNIRAVATYGYVNPRKTHYR